LRSRRSFAEAQRVALAEAKIWLIGFAAFAFAFLSASNAHAQYDSPTGSCPFLEGRPDSAAAPESFPWLDATLSPDQRVALVMAELTLEEKVDLATGEFCGLYGFFNAPIPRLRIPALTMADGPAGVRIANLEVNGGLSTALPAPIALAATWDPELARAYGDVLGKEAFLSGHNVLLGPTLDTVRTPHGGRGFETFGEDPLLQSEMAVSYIEGIQAHPVLANAKHLSVYNQETDRLNGLDVIIDERPLREIYLPAFEAAVQRADVATAMCSFNKVNGVYECEDRTHIQDILKDEFGFRGFVMSDYGATKSTLLSAFGGLDQEQPSEVFYGPKLLEAVQSGIVPLEVVNDKARRVLRPMFEFGLFDMPVQIGALPIEEDGLVARRVAEESIVLLKNLENTLPLAAGSVSSMVVIGADATNTTAQGGGSAQVDSVYGVSPLDGVRSKVGPDVTITYVEGTDPVTPAHTLAFAEGAVPSSVLTPSSGEAGAHGLTATYWASTDFSGEPVATGLDRQAAMSLGFMSYGLTPSSVESSAPPDFTSSQFSVRWTGTLTAPATGEYTFHLSTRGQGALYINGTPVINDTEPHGPEMTSTGTISLTAGTTYEIQVDYRANDPSIGAGIETVGGEALLSWTPPENAQLPNITAAVEAARTADVAIVFARDLESESLDRVSISLPNAQDQLIASVVEANPRTIVVLQTGLPVLMPWIEAVPAVMEAWYGGQEQGNAIAAVLFGDVNPSGKLPVSFPRSEEEQPAARPPNYPGVENTVVYEDGVFVGYRWYDHFDVDPLFPFGFGLSYTTFRFENLEISRGDPSEGSNSPVEVSFTVSNTGSRAGAEVAQVYVGELPVEDVQTPVRQLAGFEKVELGPGASRRITVEVDPRSLSYFSDVEGDWVTPPGSVPIYVGSSSRNIHLTGETGEDGADSEDDAQTPAPEG